MEQMIRVVEMHAKFGISPLADVNDPDPAHMLFRGIAMHEEVNEFLAAILEGNREKQLDALVDLLVFLFGTAHILDFHYLDFQKAYDRVMDANMAKELASSSSPSKRGWSLDLVKPEGWTPPDLSDLV